MKPHAVHIESGTGNVVIQIHGDGNTVDLGRPHLTLTLYEVMARRARSEVARLVAFARALPLIGRDDEMAQGRAFLELPDDIALRVMSGEAGCGKTRLALELCVAARERGWDAGFAPLRELERFLAQQNLAEWGWRAPTLIAIDNAASLGEPLRQWLAELANNPGQADKPLRILLLEREAEPGRGWWANVFGTPAQSDLGAATLLQPAEPQRLLPLASRALGRRLLDAAYAQSAGTALDDECATRVMAGPWATHPLLLQMAALQLARDPEAGLRGLDREGLCLRIAQQELDRLGEMARAARLEPVLVQHLAAGVTLAEGMERQAFLTWAKAEKHAIGWPAGGDPAALSACLSEAMASADERLAALAPDLVAEAAVLLVLDRPGVEANAVIRRAFDAAGLAVARTLVRLAQDFGAARDAPARWLRELFEALMAEDADRARQLAAQLPNQSLVLQPLLHHATERLAVHYAKGETLEVAGERYTMHSQHHPQQVHNLSLAFSEQGRHEEALQAALDAEHTLRQSVEQIAPMAAKRPRLTWWLLRRDWAQAIRRHAECCNALGDLDAALRLYGEAIEILRRLPNLPSVQRAAELSMTLHNQSVPLAHSGRLDEAIEVAREALALHADVENEEPVRASERRAQLLRTLGIHLRAAGRGGEALACVDESVRLLTPLAEARPDAHLAELAQALFSRALHRAEQGQGDAALADAREAVAAWRQFDTLVKGRGNARHELARALTMCADRAAELEQWDTAVATHAEAVALQRDAAQARPGAAHSGLAHALLKQAHALFGAGHNHDARDASDEALELFRALPPEAGAPGPHLVRALAERAQGEQGDGDAAAALPFWHEAIQAQMPFHGSHPLVPTLLRGLAGDYIGACESAGVEPDLVLLQALVNLLKGDTDD